MKPSFVFALLFAGAFAAPVAPSDEDDDCSMVWITVDGDVPEPSTAAVSASTTEAPVVTSSSFAIISTVSISAAGNKIVDTSSSSKAPLSISDINAAPTATSASSASATSATSESKPSSSISTPTRPNGDAGFPVNGDHLSAPQAKDPVPSDAALYNVPDGRNFNGTDFSSFIFKQRNVKLASKWVKIAPGTYNYDTTNNIQIYWVSGGWTFDFRDVTLLVVSTDAHPNINQAIYLDKSDDMTILGGTIWFDQGEQWSQAEVITIIPTSSGDEQVANFEVQQGYNVSAWSTAGPRNQNCLDVSNSSHYTRPNCNFWYSRAYDFSQLETSRRFTSKISGSRSGMKEGYILTMQVRPNSQASLASEWNGGLHVRGLTSNGATAQYGLGNKQTAVFEDVWYVNPPPRPGFAPRVEGPTISQGHIGSFNFDAGGEAPATYTNCF